VLVIRMALKYCILDEVLWNAARRRRTGPKRSEREELAFLGERVDRGRLAVVLAETLPEVGASLFAACERAVTSSVSLRVRMDVGARLEQALELHARRSRHVDAGLRILRRVGLAVTRRTSGPPPRARLAGGGALIALIGGDGAGKSTALEALSSWLGKELDVRVVHMGKPPWSAATYAARAAVKSAGLATGLLRRTARVGAPARAVDAYRPLVWFVCTARDRSLLYRRARSTADEGVVVLCDRYPHRLLRLMDVPQIRRLTSGGAAGRLVGRMIELEERYHDEIGKPDQMFVLRLDPEVAAVRKTTESSESVRARGAEIWTADWDGSGAHVVDAAGPAAAVAAELKEQIWSSLSRRSSAA
jgi:thymidylate kinase